MSAILENPVHPGELKKYRDEMGWLWGEIKNWNGGFRARVYWLHKQNALATTSAPYQRKGVETVWLFHVEGKYGEKQERVISGMCPYKLTLARALSLFVHDLSDGERLMDIAAITHLPEYTVLQVYRCGIRGGFFS